MWLLRERLSDFRVKQILQRVDSLIRTPKKIVFLRAIMALERFICEQAWISNIRTKGFYFIFVLCIVHTKEYMVSLILPLSFFLSFFRIHPKTWPQWHGFSFTGTLETVQNPKKYLRRNPWGNRVISTQFPDRFRLKFLFFYHFFNFQWTKTLYQNIVSHITFFLHFSRAI